MKEAGSSASSQPVEVVNGGPRVEELPSFILDLYQRAGAANFGLAIEEFAQVLREVADKYAPPGRDASDHQSLPATAWERDAAFCAGLRLEELALARACAKGSERAWDVFLVRYREKLYDAARSIAKEESAARELADSLYADLFGTSKDGAPRVSKLASYTGRGSLEGWLRTVLAREYINRYRTQRRLVSLEEQAEAGVQFPAPPSDPGAAPDARLETAAGEALGSLPAEDRFILASYYLDRRTLAGIAATLGVHESTISRRLEKITHAVRKHLVAGLLDRGMSRAQAEEALEADVRDLTLDVRKRLSEGTTQDQAPDTAQDRRKKAPVEPFH